MMRWGAYAPRVAELAALPITVRKKGSLQKDTASRDVTDPKPSTRLVHLPVYTILTLLQHDQCIASTVDTVYFLAAISSN